VYAVAQWTPVASRASQPIARDSPPGLRGHLGHSARGPFKASGNGLAGSCRVPPSETSPNH